MSKNNGGPAFPQNGSVEIGDMSYNGSTGMTLRDYFAAKAMQNPSIATGIANDLDLDRWFGKTATGITRYQIIAKQCAEAADAMLAERDK